MATEKATLKHTRLAAADLSDKQYFCVTLTTSDTVALGTTAGERILGILQNDPESGEEASVMLLGLSKAELGGSADEFEILTPDANGALVVTSDPDQIPAAVCFQGGVSGDVVTVFVFGGVAPVGAALANSLGAEQYVKVPVTSAELLAIFATPKTIVAAPGAGFAIRFHRAVIVLDYVSAAYANNGLLGFYETDASGTLLSGTTTSAGFLALTADTLAMFEPAQEATPSLVAQVFTENKALVLTQATGESITGDSPVDVHCWYSIIATGL